MNPHATFLRPRLNGIKINLNIILVHSHTKALAKLFKGTVDDILSDIGPISDGLKKITAIFTPPPNTSQILSNDDKMEQLSVIIHGIAKHILTLPRVQATDVASSENIDMQWENFSEHVDLLEGGLRQLNDIPRRRNPAHLNRVKIEIAIDSDRMRLRDELSRQAEEWRREAERSKITLVDMGMDTDTEESIGQGGSKRKKLHPLPPGYDWSTCKKIKKHMVATNIAKAPDLWCRRKWIHSLTAQKLSWKLADLEAPINGPLVDFINITDELRAYVVVLRHHTKDGSDRPKAVAIPIQGSECACPCGGNLIRHFKLLWPKYELDGESIYDLRTGDRVENHVFDTGVYDKLQNQLCIFVNKKEPVRPKGKGKRGTKTRRQRVPEKGTDSVSYNMVID